MPGYQRVDALIKYAAKPYTVKLDVFNLFDRQCYEGVYAGHAVPDTPRALQLTLTAKF